MSNIQTSRLVGAILAPLPPAIVEAERAKPSSCYTVNGKLEDFIVLGTVERNGALQPAHFVGQKYIMRDAVPGRGCLYEIDGDQVVVRRAMLGEMTIFGDKTFPILRRLDSDPSRILLSIHHSLKKGVRLNEGFKPLWSGIVSDEGKVVVADEGHSFVESPAQENYIGIFYPDGRLNDVFVRNGKVTMAAASPEDALKSRLDVVQGFLKEANGDAWQEDQALLMLPPMIRMTRGTKDLLNEIVDYIENGLKTAFRRTVREELKAALRAAGDASPYWWLADNYEEDAQPVSQEAIRKYDGRLHGFITEAIEGASSWELAYAQLVRASEGGQLRPGVQKRFCTQCPPALSVLSDKVSKLTVAVVEREQKPSPLRNKTVLSKREADARRAQNRQARLNAQPRRGSSNGGGKKGPQQKGEKKK